MKTIIVKTIIGLALFAFAGNGVAMADLYINANGDLKLVRVSDGCHAWGSSVRCDLAGVSSGWADFRLKSSRNDVGCTVKGIYPKSGGGGYHARTESYAHSPGDSREVACSQHWSNENTLNVTGKRR